MPTLVGPWVDDRARIEVDYTKTLSSDGTTAQYSGTTYFATKYWIGDDNNSWSESGDFGSTSGSNLNIDHGSSGGRTKIRNFSGAKRGDATFTVTVTGLEAYGTSTKITATFTLESGPLAPYVSGFQAGNIKSNSFLGDLTSVAPNGGTLNNARVRYNTSPSPTGATDVIRGSWGDVAVNGLVGGTLYYFAMSVSTSQYGWGPWTSWKSFTTLPAVQVRVGGTWKHAVPFVKVNGTWKQADRWVKVNGVWRR